MEFTQSMDGIVGLEFILILKVKCMCFSEVKMCGCGEGKGVVVHCCHIHIIFPLNYVIIMRVTGGVI